jgi:hypothetical protein
MRIECGVSSLIESCMIRGNNRPPGNFNPFVTFENTYEYQLSTRAGIWHSFSCRSKRYYRGNSDGLAEENRRPQQLSQKNQVRPFSRKSTQVLSFIIMFMVGSKLRFERSWQECIRNLPGVAVERLSVSSIS